MENKDQISMQYICKNCDCIFLDKDVKGRMTPIKGFYCPDCQAKGFKNPDFPPKKVLSEKQKATLKKNQFTKRKKSAISSNVSTDNTMEGK